MHTGMHSPILWIDEKTKDYLVIGIDGESFEIILSFKKGDNSWKELISWLSSSCGRPASDIAYKEHKLYCLTEDKLNVFDYESGETTLKISLQGYTPRVIFDMEGITRNCIYFNNITLENNYDEEDIFIYNLNTHKVEKPQQLFTSSVPFSCARWFLPSFKHE
ncbi:unnamed protein product [Cochlearia groenlandica]